MRNEGHLCSDPSDAHRLMYTKFPVTVTDLGVVSNECHIISHRVLELMLLNILKCWRQLLSSVGDEVNTKSHLFQEDSVPSHKTHTT